MNAEQKARELHELLAAAEGRPFTVSDRAAIYMLAADLRRALEQREGNATTPAKVPDGYYIASFKRKGSEYPGVMWWGLDNRGYSVDLEQAGIYYEITPGYHDNEYTVPVPASVIHGLRVRRIVDPGDSLNGAFHNAKTLRAMLAAAPKPEGSGHG